MPVNNKHKLHDLKNSLLAYPLRRTSTIFFGYVLMEGINDSYNDAKALIDFVKPFKARVNIIPFNKNSCKEIFSPSYNKVKTFSNWLSEKSVFVRMRTSKGNNLMAACGQLGQNIIKQSG